MIFNDKKLYNSVLFKFGIILTYVFSLTETKFILNYIPNFIFWKVGHCMLSMVHNDLMPANLQVFAPAIVYTIPGSACI